MKFDFTEKKIFFMISAFNWTPLFLTKSHPVKAEVSLLAGYMVDLAYIESIHTIAKCQENRWSIRAEILRSSEFNSNILKVSILDARRQNKSRTQISVRSLSNAY